MTSEEQFLKGLATFIRREESWDDKTYKQKAEAVYAKTLRYFLDDVIDTRQTAGDIVWSLQRRLEEIERD